MCVCRKQAAWDPEILRAVKPRDESAVLYAARPATLRANQVPYELKESGTSKSSSVAPSSTSRQGTSSLCPVINSHTLTRTVCILLLLIDPQSGVTMSSPSSFLAYNSRLRSAILRPHPPQRPVLGRIHCFRQFTAAVTPCDDKCPVICTMLIPRLVLTHSTKPSQRTQLVFTKWSSRTLWLFCGFLAA